MFEIHKQFVKKLVLVTHDTTLAERCQRQVRMTSGLLTKIESNAEDNVGIDQSVISKNTLEQA